MSNYNILRLNFEINNNKIYKEVIVKIVSKL